jgi:hypothetical protein
MHRRDDRRECTRVPIKLQAKVIAGETVVASGDTRDVGLGGLFVVTDRPLPVGTRCQMILHLEGADRQVFLPAGGRVVRAEAGGMGVEFTELGPDCFHHLRRLILADAPDPAAAREIPGPGGFRPQEEKPGEPMA